MSGTEKKLMLQLPGFQEAQGRKKKKKKPSPAHLPPISEPAPPHSVFPEVSSAKEKEPQDSAELQVQTLFLLQRCSETAVVFLKLTFSDLNYECGFLGNNSKWHTN